MDASRKGIVLVCAAIVALPLSPCAFFPSDCRAEHAERAEVAAEQERSCCAQHEAPAQPTDERNEDRPCSGECCLLSPFVPVEKVPLDASAWALFEVLAPVADAPFEELAIAPVLSRPPASLQVLHCQWRL